MWQILSHTPFYVWILLAYLIWNGWKAKNTRILSWKQLFILPVILLIWAIYSIFSNHDLISISLWICSMALGLWLGSLSTRKQKLRFDKKRKLLEISGSWIPMILALLIFSLRYGLAVTHGYNPHLKETVLLLGLDNFATLLSGAFVGRLLSYLLRSKKSPHVDLS